VRRFWEPRLKLKIGTATAIGSGIAMIIMTVIGIAGITTVSGLGGGRLNAPGKLLAFVN
jgi:hypothetical protein